MTSEPKQGAATTAAIRAPQSRLVRSDEIFEQLRREIVTGTLRPNEALIEATIAERLGVSRTPVRESLQRLYAAGLIMPRNRGWAVREFEAAHVRENAEMRVALEGYATYLAAERALDSELTEIERIHRERLALREVDEARRVETNRAFHDAVIKAAGNPSLAESIDRLGQFYFSGRDTHRVTRDELTTGNAEHARIVEALLARDPSRAEKAMRDHIYRTFAVYARTSAR